MSIDETIGIDLAILEVARKDRGIILKLFAHYDKCYRYLAQSEEDLEDLLEYCWSEAVDDGICCCANILFDINLSDREWVRFFTEASLGKETSKSYWAPPVGFAKSKEELLDFIGRRHTILHILKVAIE